MLLIAVVYRITELTVIDRLSLCSSWLNMLLVQQHRTNVDVSKQQHSAIDLLGDIMGSTEQINFIVLVLNQISLNTHVIQGLWFLCKRL